MKRVLSFILALTMTLTLCACGSGSGKLSPYLMGFQFGAGEDATEKTILDLEKNDTFTVNRLLLFCSRKASSKQSIGITPIRLSATATPCCF